MAHSGRKPTGKVMVRTFFVFCEGKTEAVYVKFLEGECKSPVRVVPKPAKSSISRKSIDNALQRRGWTPGLDRVFLMFDLDVEGMEDRLRVIDDATPLLSNPCIELWFLLHAEDVRAELTSKACLDRLKSRVADYKKGYIDAKLTAVLRDGLASAIARAKSLHGQGNPSSAVYLLVEAMEAARGRGGRVAKG